MDGGVDKIHLRRANKACYKDIVGELIEFLWGSDLHNIAIIHNYNAVSHCHGFSLVMGDVNESGIQLVMQFSNLCSCGGAQLGI